MNRVFKLIIITIFIFIINSNVYASNIHLCTPTEEYEEWISLPEEERNKLDKPKFCKEAIGANAQGQKDAESSSYASITSDGEIKYATASSTYYNAIKEGFVTSIKNQMQTGSCWTFSTTSLIETQAIKEGYAPIIEDKNNDGIITSNEDTIDLSEMHMLFGTSYDAFSDVNDFGKVGRYYYPSTDGKYRRTFETGGNNDVAFSYLMEPYSIVNESVLSFEDATENYGYKRINKPISYDSYSLDSKLFNINDYIMGASSSDYVENLKERIIKYGSAEVSIYSSTDFFTDDEMYYSNLYTEITNHSATVVGWDDTIPASSFKSYTIGNKTYQVTTPGAWIIKNSWGYSFGNNGIFYASYESIDIRNSNGNFIGVDTNNYDYLYKTSSQTAIFNHYVNPGYSDIEAVKFNLKGEDEYLRKIVIPVSPFAKYDIYLAYQENDSWKSESNWTLLKTNITSEYESFKSIFIDNPIKLEKDYVIIVKATSTSSTQRFYVATSSVIDIEDYESYYNDTNADTSYVYDEDTNTWSDRYNAVVYGTFSGVRAKVSKFNYGLYVYTSELDLESTTYDIKENEIDIGFKSKQTAISKSSFINNIDCNQEYKIYDKNNQDITDSVENIGTGMKLYIPSMDITYDIVVCGDVNGNGRLQSNDALLIQRYIVGLDSKLGGK